MADGLDTQGTRSSCCCFSGAMYVTYLLIIYMYSTYSFSSLKPEAGLIAVL
jgi:hypothetical protein